MEIVQFNKLKWDFLIGAIAINAACGFTLLLIIGYADPVPKPVAYVILLFITVLVDILLALDWYAEKQKVIRIDETGISLKKNGKLEWAFTWDEIEGIWKSNPYRHRGVAFKPKDPTKIDLWTISKHHQYEFHMNKTAKVALTRYCKLPIKL